MAQAPVNLTTTGPPETILDPEHPEAYNALNEALNLQGLQRHAALAAILYRWPSFLEGWAQRGESARDEIEAYAAFRVGYHRGLDRLRENGWRGRVMYAGHTGKTGVFALFGWVAALSCKNWRSPRSSAMRRFFAATRP